jgi:hypothetical protein
MTSSQEIQEHRSTACVTKERFPVRAMHVPRPKDACNYPSWHMRWTQVDLDLSQCFSLFIPFCLGVLRLLLTQSQYVATSSKLLVSTMLLAPAGVARAQLRGLQGEKRRPFVAVLTTWLKSLIPNPDPDREKDLILDWDVQKGFGSEFGARACSRGSRWSFESSMHAALHHRYQPSVRVRCMLLCDSSRLRDK